MRQEEGKVASAFQELAEAERAFRALRRHGVRPEAIQLECCERCGACEREQAEELKPREARLLAYGQTLGGVLGLLAGLHALGGPGWSDGLTAALGVAGWSGGGVIVGTVGAALLNELGRERSGGRHRHVIMWIERSALPAEGSRILARHHAQIDPSETQSPK